MNHHGTNRLVCSLPLARHCAKRQRRARGMYRSPSLSERVNATMKLFRYDQTSDVEGRNGSRSPVFGITGKNASRMLEPLRSPRLRTLRRGRQRHGYHLAAIIGSLSIAPNRLFRSKSN